MNYIDSLEDELDTTTEELHALRLAYKDALDAMDFAASEGFEWPKDPYTPNIKFMQEFYKV